MLITEANWKLHTDTIGAKALNLFKMRDFGIQVPKLIALESIAFDEHRASIHHFDDLLDAINFQSPQTLRETASRIRSSIIETPLAHGAEALLRKALEDHFPRGTYMAVRSSALGEDSENQSFAGQMDSFLFLENSDQVLAAIKQCWASLYSDRALTYRKTKSIDLKTGRIGVVIQEMIEGEVSGVAFSINPLTQRRNEILISSTFGLGEGIVSGALNTDQFVVDRRSQKILEKDIVEKNAQIGMNRELGSGTIEEEIADELANAPSLEDAQVLSLSSEICKIEEFYSGVPQDIEWTLAQNEIFILQSRPITTLSQTSSPSSTESAQKEETSFQTIWDNSNIVESYSGVTTPLTYTFANHCYFMVYVQFCEILGVPREKIQKLEPSFRNMLGLLRGRIYYNLKNWCRLISVLPGYSYNREFMEQMMGVKEPIPFTPESETSPGFLRRYFVELPRLLGAAVRLLYRFLMLDRDVRRFTKTYLSTYEQYRRVQFTELSLHEIVDAYNDMERRVLRQWKPPIVNDFMAMIFYGLLKSFIVKWKIDEKGSLQNQLLSDQGDVESTLPIKRLQEIAAYLRTRPDLKLKMASDSQAELVAYFLKAPRTYSASEARLREMLLKYLDDYGFRCMNELKLEEPSLLDRPDFLFTILKNYLSSPEPIKGAEETKESVLAYQQVLRTLKGQRLLKVIPKSWIFKIVLHYAKKAVRVREYQRFARTKMFGLMRGLFQACGHKLWELKMLEEPRDIFYLTREEILGTIVGAGVTEDLSHLAKQRRLEFAAYQAEDELADRIITRGAVLSRDLKPAAASVVTAGDLKGTSCCPGFVRGRVKVIASPSDDMSLNGEILVAARTDPGWVTLYPSAIGLLIERGSVLSHSAIVARELGLPAILGIPQITKILKTGDWVEMDGASGTVRILNEEEIANVRQA